MKNQYNTAPSPKSEAHHAASLLAPWANLRVADIRVAIVALLSGLPAHRSSSRKER